MVTERRYERKYAKNVNYKYKKNIKNSRCGFCRRGQLVKPEVTCLRPEIHRENWGIPTLKCFPKNSNIYFFKFSHKRWGKYIKNF